MKSRGCIMIVSGDAPSRTALEDLLVDDGFSVTTAVDGAGAARVLEALAPDVLIIDGGMPGTSTAALARASLLQERERPVLLLTTHEPWNVERRDLDEGRCIPITKPVDFDALVVLLDSLLALARSRRP